MIGIVVANLVIPNDPMTLTLTLPAGTWDLNRVPTFQQNRAAMSRGMCAETYFLDTPISISTHGQAASTNAVDELTPILLGATYATGLAVTSRRSTMSSEVMLLQALEHWPRDRAMDAPSMVVSDEHEFADIVCRFVHSWPNQGIREKARLLVHHWIDALVCWSLEDLYLSATTLLQIIVATEADRRGKTKLEFRPGVNAAADRFGIRILSPDFKDMRNELIHDGRLIGTRFVGPDKSACAAVAVDVLNWIDEYIHAALVLGHPRRQRFSPADFLNLNAYSID